MKTLFGRKKRYLIVILVIALLTGTASVLNAQSIITYGTTTNGTLTVEVPNAFLIFNGNAGDLVTAEVSAVSLGLDPSLIMLMPVQPNSVSNFNDPLFLGTTDSRITFRLPAPGAYTLIVGSQNGVLGDFSLSLSASLPVTSEFLAPGIYQVNVPPGAPVNYYSFAAPAGVRVTSLTLGLQFVTSVLNGNGEISAVSTGDAVETRYNFDVPSPNPYQLNLAAKSLEMGGVIEIEIYALPGVAPATGGFVQTPAPVLVATSTPMPVLGDIGPSDVCTVSPAIGNVNLRAGPGTDYQVTGQLIFGQRANPIARAMGTDGFSWWQLPPFGSFKWVRSDVVIAKGACSVIAEIAPPAPPTLIATYTLEPSQTPVIITATPSVTPMVPPSVTPSATPIVPPPIVTPLIPVTLLPPPMFTLLPPPYVTVFPPPMFTLVPGFQIGTLVAPPGS